MLIEAGGARVLTDPMLRSRTAHLRRHGPAPNLENLGALDAVLLSHLHLDHCDLRSLALLGKDVRLLAPPGAGSFLRRRGFRAVEELPPGATARVGGLTISPTPARHSGRRPPLGPVATATGFLLEGALRRLYFAGDTDLFPEMADLALGLDGRPLDAALLPVWGWGPTLGPGHLDPHRAALHSGCCAPPSRCPSTGVRFARQPSHDRAATARPSPRSSPSRRASSHTTPLCSRPRSR
ncbi:MAG: MBL fold metallo-hydrolase [Chloroflexia bacterium]